MPTLAMIASRTLSTPVFDAASISCTSIDRLSVISARRTLIRIVGTARRPASGCSPCDNLMLSRAGEQWSSYQRHERLKRGKHDEGADARSHCGVRVSLACYFVEGLRAPLPGDYLIGHLQFGLHQQDHERFSRGVLNSFKIFQAIVKPPSSFIFTTRKATSRSLES